MIPANAAIVYHNIAMVVSSDYNETGGRQANDRIM